MPASILDLFRGKALEPKKKTSTEWASPCPSCGGKDRCSLWPEDQEGRGYYWCRQCGTQGNGIQFLRDFHGMGYAEACRAIGVAVQQNLAPPRFAPGPNRREKLVPKSKAAPEEGPAAFAAGQETDRALWREKATIFAAWAHLRLLETPEVLQWLARRGLDEAAVRRYGLGWNPGERGQSGIVRSRQSWGLPEQLKADGKPKQLWLPKGLVIPQLGTDAGGKSHARRLRIRRPEEERQRFMPDQKFFVIPGSEMDALYLCRRHPSGSDRSGCGINIIAVVESELDALLLHHLAGDLMGVAAAMTSTVKALPPRLFSDLEKADCILVALDFDDPDKEGKRAGAEGWPRWNDTFPRAKRWPVPVGKDPGEAFARGENLRLWLWAGLPEGLRFAMSAGQSAPGVAKEKGAAEKREARTQQERRAPSAPSRWGGQWADVPLRDVALPTGAPTVEHLRRYYAGKIFEDDLLIPCPKTSTPWWWTYYKSCRKCAGHSLCLLGFVMSSRMLALLEEASIRDTGEVRVSPESSNSPGRPDAVASDQENSLPSCSAAVMPDADEQSQRNVAERGGIAPNKKSGK